MALLIVTNLNIMAEKLPIIPFENDTSEDIEKSKEPSYLNPHNPQLTDKLLSIQHKVEHIDWFKYSLQTSLEKLLHILMELDWIDGGGVYLFDNNTEDLVLTSHTGLSKEFLQERQKFSSDSPQMNLIRKNKFFFGNYKVLIKKTKSLSHKGQVNSIAVLPLVHFNKVLGVINMASEKLLDIPENDQMALESIASKVVTHILYHNTLKELKESRSELEAKVKSRTSDLKAANVMLNNEIAIRKKTEVALVQSENLYHSIFDNANDGIVLYDINTLKIVDLNTKAHEDLNYTREEFLKLDTQKYTIYESEEQRNKIIQHLFEEKYVKYNVKHITKYKKLKYQSISANIVTINNTQYILGIVRDNTEIKEKELELKLKDEQINTLQENVSVGLFRADKDGNITYSNKYLTKILGKKSVNEIVGKNIVDYIISSDTINLIRNRVNSKDQIQNLELNLKDNRNKDLWVLLNVKRINDSEGMVLYYDGSVEDITTLKKTLFKLEKANKKITSINKTLEIKINNAVKKEQQQQDYIIQKSKLESLGEMAAGIAHEINQPLGIMSLSFENLQLKFNNESVTKEYLEQKITSIIANIDRIRDIINHIRIFSREQDSIVMQKVEVNQVVLDVNKLIKTQYQNHNISIIHDLQEDLGFTVGSNLKLEQVILNLLSNAKYALDDMDAHNADDKYKKTIRIKTLVVNNRINLMIQDNGVGIDEKKLNKIFDPFYTTKPEWVGTGLGLSIVYGIVKEMHGEIFVKSKIGKFTRFDIFLPRFPEKV